MNFPWFELMRFSIVSGVLDFKGLPFDPFQQELISLVRLCQNWNLNNVGSGITVNFGANRHLFPYPIELHL